MRHNKFKLHLVHEINMTPFIDVMLVLLIIFMITAPLLTVGIEVDLPKTQAGTLTEQVEPLVLSIDKSGNIFIMETKTSFAALIPRLKAITQNNPKAIIYIQADRRISHGLLMDVMGRLSYAGFKKVALIGEAANSPSSKRG